MRGLSLIKARYVYHGLDVLRDVGAPIGRIVSNAGLSEEILDDPNNLIAKRQLSRFLEVAARTTGIESFGARMFQSLTDGHGDLGVRVSKMPTLTGTIRAFCDGIREESSEGGFSFSEVEDCLYFYRDPLVGTTEEIRQDELYNILLLIEIVRSSVGSSWRPQRLWLQMAEIPSEMLEWEAFSQARIYLGCTRTALEVPLTDLCKSARSTVVPRSKDSYDQPVSVNDQKLPTSITESLKLWLSYQLKSGYPTIEMSAEMMGVSKRTLQRELSKKQLTYRSLIEDIRMEKAVRYLESPEVKFSEIALDLGYEDYSNFVRAFRRWSGVSPTKYRDTLPAL